MVSGQGDLILVFQNNPNRWFTSKELHTITGQNLRCLNRMLKKMRMYNEINFRRLPIGNGRTYEYRWK